MMGPLNILGIVGFWGVASRLFTLRQGKRLFGLIDSGQIIGMIIISLMIPVLIKLLPDNKDLLYISAFSVLIAFFIQVIISSKFSLNKRLDESTHDKVAKIKISEILKHKYIVYMSLFIILSMIAAFFVAYIFLPITKIKYPNNDEYYTFLGGFTAVLMIFTLLFKTLAYSKLTKSYGLKVNLILPAILLGAFVVLLFIVSLFLENSIESSVFMLFFLLASLSRLFSVSLKSSIEVPSLKLLYQSLNNNIKYRVQVMIDGMVNETAAIIAGLLLLGFSFIGTTYHLLLLFVIIVAWIFVAIKLYNEYRHSLEITLDEVKHYDLESVDEKTFFLSKNIIKKQNISSIIEYSKAISPLNYSELYVNCLSSNNDSLRIEILNRIRKEYAFGLINNLRDYSLKESNIELKNKTDEIIKDFEELLDKNKLSLKISDLVYSIYSEDRLVAVNIIKELNEEDTSKYLIILLRDFYKEIKIDAIKAAAIIHDKESLPVIIDSLSDKELNFYAYETIKSYGDKALHSLELYFYKSGLSTKVQIQIIRLFGLLKGESVIKFLLNKLNYSNREVIIESCAALQSCGYIAQNDDEKQILNQLIIRSVKITAWNINLLVNINEHESLLELKEEINREIEKNYNEIYQVLSILYEPSSVSHVRKNLETDTAESISFGLELLDLFVDERTKAILFILFEDISNNEKTRRFQDHFALKKLSSDEIINSVINRDVNYISKWTKAIAINSIGALINYNITDDIIAQIFNNNKLLSQLASKVSNNIDPKQFIDSTKRLDKKKSVEIKKLIRDNGIIFNTIGLLKQLDLFKNVRSTILSEIITESTEIRLTENETINIKPNTKNLYILLDGDISTVILEKEHKYSRTSIIDNKNKIVTEDIVFKAVSNSRILLIKFEILVNYMKYYKEISHLFLKIN